MALYPAKSNQYLVKDEFSQWMTYISIFGMGIIAGIAIAGWAWV